MGPLGQGGLLNSLATMDDYDRQRRMQEEYMHMSQMAQAFSPSALANAAQRETGPDPVLLLLSNG